MIMFNLINKIFSKQLLLAVIFLSVVQTVFAQTETAMETEMSSWQKFISMDPLLITVVILLVFVMFIVLIAMIYLVNISSFLILQIQIQKQKATGGEYVEPKSIWDKFKEKFVTGKLYAEKEEKTSMMLDHEYDGIREMDYGMPPWLTAIFVGTIVFAIAYLVQIWGIGNIEGQIAEYHSEVMQAEIDVAEWRAKQANLIDENSVAFVTEDAQLEQGKEIFLKECKACHAVDGGGGVGPNLTDNYWIHGGSIQDVFKTIKYGVPEKGMISWQSKLNPGDMQSVASYILTLVGTSPADPKEPQGELFAGDDSGAKENPESESNVDSDSTQIISDSTDI